MTTNQIEPFPIEPFHIEISDDDLADLRARLAGARLGAQVPGTGWERGIPLDHLRRLVARWLELDWRAAEARLNAFPQVRTVIDGQPVHAFHVRSPEPDALPLLLAHGYPSLPVEFLGIAGPLTDPAAYGGDPRDAFHLVVPSLPGFGFSTPVHEPGWDLGRSARAFAELMRRLGYDRYGAHGGDMGAGLVGMLAAFDAAHVAGVHISSDVQAAVAMSDGYVPVDVGRLSPAQRARYDAFREAQRDGKGYLAIQSTKPQTIGYALTDSPAGQLAWIAEKFEAWTDQRKLSPGDAVDVDLLLTLVSLYWFTRSGASAAHAIYENSHPLPGAPNPWAGAGAPSAPVGWAVFGGLDDIVPTLYNPDGEIAHWSQFDEGGHFPAMETPGLLVADLRAFYRGLRGATVSG
ncbi:epoxide hydrolase family protein [Microbispora amethystogenes]|uniref:epoxide hydrolase family protein n=1 Tax=Microbispora amethystogenes TaxID=1427754 RepID=UPI0033F19A8E